MIGFFRDSINTLQLRFGASEDMPANGLPMQPVTNWPGFMVGILPKAKRGERRRHRLIVRCRCGRDISMGRIARHRRFCNA